MGKVDEIREELLEHVSRPVLDNYDQARFALAARDAYWDGVREHIDGDHATDLYDEFVSWQHQLEAKQLPYARDVRRSLRDQVENASHPQIFEYRDYLERVVRHEVGPPSWQNVGYVEVSYGPKGPYDDGPHVAVVQHLAGGSEGTHHVLDEGEEFEDDVRAGWRLAFEAMVPLYVRTEWGLRSAWLPWVDKGDVPGNVAAALERLFLGQRLTDRQVASIGRLVSPVGIAVVLLDPDMDRDFWAGEWTNDFIQRAPDRVTGESVLADRAPELWDAIGGND